jgi:hypothetical protein
LYWTFKTCDLWGKKGTLASNFQLFNAYISATWRWKLCTIGSSRIQSLNIRLRRYTD